MLLFSVLPVCAADLTEAEVEQAVAEQGKERSPEMCLYGFYALSFFLSQSEN